MPELKGSGSAQKKSPGLHYGYVILLIGVLTVTGALGFARFGYTTILPSMKAGLGLGNTEMGMLATGNLAGYMLFSLVSGFLASKYGPRLVIVFSMLLAGSTMFLTGLVGGTGAAVVFRFLTGLGSAGSNIPVMGLVTAWFAPRYRGTASGLMVGGSGVALLVTGFLIPRIIAQWPQNGWRISWFILGGCVVLLGMLSCFFLRNSPAEKNVRPIDWEPTDNPVHKPKTGNQKGCGSGANLKWGNVYGSRVLWHLGTIYFAFGFSYIVYATFFSISLVSDKGLTQEAAGGMWALVGVLSVFSSVIWGRFSDVLGRRYALTLIFALEAICYLVFAVSSSTALLYFSVILFGLTCWSIPGVVAAACGDCVGPRLAPAALGMVTLFLGVGQALAPSVAGYTADITNSFNLAFMMAAAVAVLGSVGSLTLRLPLTPGISSHKS